MNPLIIQAVSAERVREMHASAAAWRRAREIRRDSSARSRLERKARGRASLGVLRSRHDLAST